MTTAKRNICWLHIFSIVGLGIVLTLPKFFNGCLVSGHDFAAHFIYIKHFSEQFWQGEFYPRWLHNMNAGFGSPTFFFYAPLPYYFTSLFSPLSYFNLSICDQISLSTLLALVASGITAYFWLKEIVPRDSAVIAAVVYMAWPYHLAFDLYIRLAFAEYWSFVWMPLILCFSIKIVRGSKLSTIGLAISFALLALTHLPTFIIFFPVPIGYALFIASRNQWKTISLYLGLAVLISTGLSAIYWLPAMTTQESISMDAILTAAYDYANNFLFTGPKVGHGKIFWRSLELLTLLTGGWAFCSWKISKKSREIIIKRESNYWMIVAGLSLFMTLPMSQFIWQALPVLQRIQFPWRFNAVLTVAVAALFALAIAQLKANYNLPKVFNKSLFLQLLYLAAIIITLAAIYILPLQGKIIFPGSRSTVLSLSLIYCLLMIIAFSQRPIILSIHKFFSAWFLLTVVIFLGSYLYCHEKTSFLRISDLKDFPSYLDRIDVSQATNEHRPQWVPKEVFNAKDLARLSSSTPTVQQIDAGKVGWQIKQYRPRMIVLQTDATTETELTIHQFYYPGWTARLKGIAQNLPIHYSELGLLQISVPAGQHEIYITLDSLIEEKIGQITSLFSAILTLFLVFILRRSPKLERRRKCTHRIG